MGIKVKGLWRIFAAILIPTWACATFQVPVSTNNVQGMAASTSAVVGNPVPMGAVYNKSHPTLTEGQVIFGQVDASGNILFNLQTAIPAGSAIIGAFQPIGISTVVPGAVALVTISSQTTVLPGPQNVVISATSTINTSQQGNITINAIPTGTNNIGTVTGSTVTINTTQGGTLPISGTVTALPGAQNVVVSATATINTSQQGALPAGTNTLGNMNVLGVSSMTILNGSGAAATVGYGVSGASVPVNVLNTPSVTGTLGDNGNAATTNRVPILPGIYQKWGAGTGGTLTDNAALEVMPDHGLHANVYPAESGYSYRASTTVASAASATDICSFAGNASSTTLVYGVHVTGTQTTAGIIPITILRRSSNDIGGTKGSTVTVVSDDPSDYAAAESTAVYTYTANPTTRGTLVGCIDTEYVGVMASGTATPNDIFFEANLKIKPQVLKGTTQELDVSLAAPCDGVGTTVTGGVFACSWEIIEHPNITP